jgi:hypothetical protein
VESVSIRNLRGKNLREKALEGKLLMITNRGALIGVVIPVASGWLEHMIDYNLSLVQQSIDEAEQAMAADRPMSTMKDVIAQLSGLLNPRADASQEIDDASPPSPLTVRIGDLSAHLIEDAGAKGRTIAVTHDRKLIAMVIPITRDLVEFLLEQNMSRVLYNVGLAEKEMRAGHPMTPLDQVTGRSSGPAGSPVEPSPGPGAGAGGHAAARPAEASA